MEHLTKGTICLSSGPIWFHPGVDFYEGNILHHSHFIYRVLIIMDQGKEAQVMQQVWEH